MGGGSPAFDKLKKQFMDLVYDLHARKLAIPAGALLVAILAAVFVLPKSPTPPPPPANTAPAAATQTGPTGPKMQPVANLTLVGVTPLDDSNPLSFSVDPFTGRDGYKCKTYKKGPPKLLACRVADLEMLFICPATGGGPLCVGATGGTGATASGGGAGSTGAVGGSTGGGGGGAGGGSTGGGSAPKKKTSTKSTYYVVNVTLDGRSYKNVIAGDGLPNDTNTIVVFAGVNDAQSKAIFIAGDNVSVTGATVDPNLGNFELAKGKSVTLMDSGGANHTMKLTAITKVTK